MIKSRYFYIKSVLDWVVALVMVIVISPLILFIIIILLVFQDGRVFFRQVRSGYQDTPFLVYKFTTMTERIGKDDESRITPIGNVLRSSSLDEIPQLFNILRGEMSFVGPRPLPIAYSSLLSARHRRRFEVKPGITGWVQVKESGDSDWVKRFDSDLEYVENQSMLLDLKIFVATFRVLWRPEKNKAESFRPFTGYPQ